MKFDYLDCFWNEHIFLGTVNVYKLPEYCSESERSQSIFAKVIAYYAGPNTQVAAMTGQGILCVDCSVHRSSTNGEVEPKMAPLAQKEQRYLESVDGFEAACRRTVTIADEWISETKRLFEANDELKD